MRKMWMLVVLASFLVFAACSDKSDEAGPGPGPEPATSFSEQSQQSLKTPDITNIEDVHCNAYNSDKTNAQAAFGCFMAKTATMLEGTAATDFLAALGEPPIHVQEDILSTTNPNSLCSKLAAQTGGKKFHSEFPNIPFSSSIDFAHTTYHAFFREMMKRVKNGNIPLSRFRDDIYALDGNLTELIALLNVPRATDGFTFTIPKETCQVSKDIVVKKIDLEGFYALLGSLKLATNLMNAYDIGLDPQSFVSAEGKIDRAAFVTDANGGADGKEFVYLKPGAGNISSLQPLALAVADSIITFVDTVKSSADSDVFWAVVKHHGKFISNLKKYATDLKTSLEAPSILTPMTQSGRPNIQIDVNKFMSSLPDPASVTSSDPFVMTATQKVKFVADFFKTLLNGTVNF